jgi:hypothetical protein
MHINKAKAKEYCEALGYQLVAYFVNPRSQGQVRSVLVNISETENMKIDSKTLKQRADVLAS